MSALLERYERQAVLLNQPREIPLHIRENLAHAGLLRFLGLPQPEMFDAHKNFAYSTVATAPSPASSGTSLVVASGDGAKFPATPFNATVWPAGVQPTTANAEIVRVTNISTDTLTLTRTQESSSARSIVVGDQIAATITTKTLTDVETAIPSGTQLVPSSPSDASQFLDGAATPAWAYPPGHEFGYDQITGNVSVTATTESAGTTVITCAAHTFDGAAVMAEFFAPWVSTGHGASVIVSLFEGSTEIGKICEFDDPSTTFSNGSPMTGRLKFTPSAASHTYKVTAINNGATGTINAGAGGTATFVPAFVRFTKV